MILIHKIESFTNSDNMNLKILSENVCHIICVNDMQKKSNGN